MLMNQATNMIKQYDNFEILIFKSTDDKLMHIIQPGGYAYIYEGVERTWKGDDSESEEDKLQESLRIKSCKIN